MHDYYEGPLERLVGSDGVEIMSFGDNTEYYPTEGCGPNDANAALIAAAPQLLAACRAWDEGFTEGEQFTAEQFRVWVNERRRMAREAIAAATTLPEV